MASPVFVFIYSFFMNFRRAFDCRAEIRKLAGESSSF